MNLLPHKSWNVWNRDNREKVEKDQKEHQEKEDKKRKRLLEIVCNTPLTLVHIQSNNSQPDT